MVGKVIIVKTIKIFILYIERTYFVINIPEKGTRITEKRKLINYSLKFYLFNNQD